MYVQWADVKAVAALELCSCEQLKQQEAMRGKPESSRASASYQ
jgi:hypothetical protein